MKYKDSYTLHRLQTLVHINISASLNPALSLCAISRETLNRARTPIHSPPSSARLQKHFVLSCHVAEQSEKRGVERRKKEGLPETKQKNHPARTPILMYFSNNYMTRRENTFICDFKWKQPDRRVDMIPEKLQ